MAKEYIEREAVIQRLKNSPLFTNFGEDGFFICNGVIDIIKKQPSVKSAADMVEVRHGHWINDICSVCRVDLGIYDIDWFKYCPYCGAKMDGKDGAE